MAKKKKKKISSKKKVQRYKSLFTGRPLTIQQFLVEVIYSNNGIKDVTKYIGGNAYRRKEYTKVIAIISRLLKKVLAEDLFEVIREKRVKKAEDLPWRIEKIEYVSKLKELPKDYTEPEEIVFKAGEDKRDYTHSPKKDEQSLFEKISGTGGLDE